MEMIYCRATDKKSLPITTWHVTSFAKSYQVFHGIENN